MFRKILFPTDLSDLSRKGLTWTAINVADPSSEIILVHVVEPMSGIDTSPMMIKAEEAMAGLESELSALGIKSRALVLSGDPFDLLPEIAHSEGCSISTTFADLNDVVVPFIRLMAIPHLVVKTADGSMPPPDPFRKIALTTDLSPERTDTVLRELKNLLGGRTVPLTILHSVAMEYPSTSTEMFQIASSALEEVRGAVETWNPGTEAGIFGGEPEVEILHKVSELDPGILVVGLSVHGHLWELIIGSTGESIIERAPCPVLVIPS